MYTYVHVYTYMCICSHTCKLLSLQYLRCLKNHFLPFMNPANCNKQNQSTCEILLKYTFSIKKRSTVLYEVKPETIYWIKGLVRETLQLNTKDIKRKKKKGPASAGMVTIKILSLEVHQSCHSFGEADPCLGGTLALARCRQEKVRRSCNWLLVSFHLSQRRKNFSDVLYYPALCTCALNCTSLSIETGGENFTKIKTLLCLSHELGIYLCREPIVLGCTGADR